MYPQTLKSPLHKKGHTIRVDIQKMEQCKTNLTALNFCTSAASSIFKVLFDIQLCWGGFPGPTTHRGVRQGLPELADAVQCSTRTNWCEADLVVACPECGQPFADKYTMKRHLQRHQQRRQYFECPLCPKRFSRKDSVYVHMRNSHS